MNAERSASQRGPRPLPVTNAELEFGNVEAWINVIRSYLAKHPGHKVVLLYDGEPVANLLSLYRMRHEISRDRFALQVEAPADERGDVAKLFRLLVEAAGPDYRRYLQKELHRVLTLF